MTGLWGSGNVVTTEQGRLTGNGTAYTMWDGHALFGEGRPGTLEKFPALLAVLSIEAFLDRYGSLGADCQVWTGEEELGFDCDAACANLEAVCPDKDPGDCRATCPRLPRSITDCIASVGRCEDQFACGTEAWLAR
ncbi:MAG: hypothetical protein ABMB14_14790 [Myxococcota bacterium]